MAESVELSYSQIINVAINSDVDQCAKIIDADITDKKY